MARSLADRLRALTPRPSPGVGLSTVRRSRSWSRPERRRSRGGNEDHGGSGRDVEVVADQESDVGGDRPDRGPDRHHRPDPVGQQGRGSRRREEHPKTRRVPTVWNETMHVRATRSSMIAWWRRGSRPRWLQLLGCRPTRRRPPPRPSPTAWSSKAPPRSCRGSGRTGSRRGRPRTSSSSRPSPRPAPGARQQTDRRVRRSAGARDQSAIIARAPTSPDHPWEPEQEGTRDAGKHAVRARRRR